MKINFKNKAVCFLKALNNYGSLMESARCNYYPVKDFKRTNRNK